MDIDAGGQRWFLFTVFYFVYDRGHFLSSRKVLALEDLERSGGTGGSGCKITTGTHKLPAGPSH